MAVQKFIKRVLIPGGTVVAIPTVIPLLYAEEGNARGDAEQQLKFVNENVEPPPKHSHGLGQQQQHAHHIESVAAAAAAASVYVSPQDLPIYDGPQLPPAGSSSCHHDSIEQDPSQLQQGVTIVRQTVMTSVENLKVDENKDKILENIDTGVKRVKNAYAYITLEDNYLPRAAAISTGGLIGLLMARRGGVIKRFFYTSLGLTAMASVCYPKQAVVISEDLFKIGKYYAIVAYQKIQEADRRRRNPVELKKPSDWARSVGVAKLPVVKVVKVEELEDYDEEEYEEDDYEDEEDEEEEERIIKKYKKDLKSKGPIKNITKPSPVVDGKSAKPVVELKIGAKDVKDKAVMLATGVKEKKFTTKAASVEEKGKDKEKEKREKSGEEKSPLEKDNVKAETVLVKKEEKEKDIVKAETVLVKKEEKEKDKSDPVVTKEKESDKKEKEEKAKDDEKKDDNILPSDKEKVASPVESFKEGVKYMVTMVNVEESEVKEVKPTLPKSSVDEDNIWLAASTIPDIPEDQVQFTIEITEKPDEKVEAKSSDKPDETKPTEKPLDSGDASSTPKDALKLLEEVIDAEKTTSTIKPLDKFTISATDAQSTTPTTTPEESSKTEPKSTTTTSTTTSSTVKGIKPTSDEPPPGYKRIKIRTRRERVDNADSDSDKDKEKRTNWKLRKALLHRDKKAARNWNNYDSDDENERPRKKKHRKSAYPKNTINIPVVDETELKRTRSKSPPKNEKSTKEEVTAAVSGIASSGASLLDPDSAPTPFESDSMYKFGKNLAKNKLTASAKSKITKEKKPVVFDDDDDDIFGDNEEEKEKDKSSVESSPKKTEVESSPKKTEVESPKSEEISPPEPEKEPPAPVVTLPPQPPQPPPPPPTPPPPAPPATPPPPPFTFREESLSEAAETPLFELHRQEHLYSLPRALPKEFEIVGEMDTSSPIWGGLSSISAEKDPIQEASKLNQFIQGLQTPRSTDVDTGTKISPIWTHPGKDEAFDKKEGFVGASFTMGGSPVAKAPTVADLPGIITTSPKTPAAAHDSSKLPFAGVQAMKEERGSYDFKQVDYDDYDYDDAEAEDYDYVIVSDPKEVYRPLSKSPAGKIPLTPAL